MKKYWTYPFKTIEIANKNKEEISIYFGNRLSSSYIKKEKDGYSVVYFLLK